MLLFRRYWIAKLLKFVQLGTWSTLKCWNSLRALFTAAKSLAFTAPYRTIKYSPHLWTGRLPFLQLCFNESLRQNWYLTSPSTSSIESKKQKAKITLIFSTEKKNVQAYCTNPPPAQKPQLSLLSLLECNSIFSINKKQTIFRGRKQSMFFSQATH